MLPAAALPGTEENDPDSIDPVQNAIGAAPTPAAPVAQAAMSTASAARAFTRTTVRKLQPSDQEE